MAATAGLRGREGPCGPHGENDTLPLAGHRPGCCSTHRAQRGPAERPLGSPGTLSEQLRALKAWLFPREGAEWGPMPPGHEAVPGAKCSLPVPSWQEVCPLLHPDLSPTSPQPRVEATRTTTSPCPPPAGHQARSWTATTLSWKAGAGGGFPRRNRGGKGCPWENRSLLPP